MSKKWNVVGMAAVIGCLSVLGMGVGAQRASADLVFADVRGFVNGGMAYAQACNTAFSTPIRCRVGVRGYFPNGQFMYAWADMVLAPGRCDNAYVYSALYNFSYAEGEASCVYFNPAPVVPGPGPFVPGPIFYPYPRRF